MDKEIILTKDEEKKFYELKSAEDACMYALSPEIINNLTIGDVALAEYVKSCTDNYAKHLSESNDFLNSLRKKYNVSDFIIDVDKLIPKNDGE